GRHRPAELPVPQRAGGRRGRHLRRSGPPRGPPGRASRTGGLTRSRLTASVEERGRLAAPFLFPRSPFQRRRRISPSSPSSAKASPLLPGPADEQPLSIEPLPPSSPTSPSSSPSPSAGPSPSPPVSWSPSPSAGGSLPSSSSP